jgi:signal transduction histidine kinase
MVSGAPITLAIESVVRQGAPPCGIPRAVIRNARFRYTIGVILAAGLYYGSARIGYEFEFAGPVAAIVWFPAGVGVSFLYLGGLRFWPGVLAGDLLANDYSALPVGTALLQTCGNMIEMLLAAFLIRRLVGRRSPLGVRGIPWVLVAIAAGTAVSATVGSLALLPWDVVNASDLPTVWRTWWLGDASGALVVVPFAIAWFRQPGRPLAARRWFEGALLLVATVALSELALHSFRTPTYLFFPPLIWAALRFGQRGATLALAIVVSLSVWETTHYVGPFVYETVTRSVLNSQLFIAVAALSTLFLAAVVAERERLVASLTASRARLATAADAERRRLERNLHDGAQQRLFVLAHRMREARERARDAPEQAFTLYEEAEEELRAAVDELRELAHGIHPPLLTELGLAKAIEDIAVRSPVPVELIDLPSGRFGDVVEATAYYVVAEAITNVQRHAGAASIRVRLAAPHGVLHIAVADDGVGGASEALGSGLRGLRDRVDAAGGRFHVWSSPGRGTRIAASIPVATE